MARNTTRLTGALMLALALAVALPTAALAGKGKGGTSTQNESSASSATTDSLCGYSTSQTFAAFGDLAYYHLAPGGDAESNAWRTRGGASVVSGQGILAQGAKVYSLPKGGSVTSRSFCLTYDSPTVRFSVNDPGVAGATLKVEAMWTSVFSGESITAPIATIQSGKAGVRLVDPCFVLANLSAMVSGTGTVSVQLRITAESGNWQVDDVYVDPFKRV